MSYNIQGDNVGGDKVLQDKFLGNKAGRDYYEIHQYLSPESAPELSLDEALAQLDQLPLDTVPKPGYLPPNSRLPHSPNTLFTGRIQDFKTLAQALKGRGPDGKFEFTLITTAVTGLGGVGKTQLAAEFAHRYGRYFLGGVYWLSFADPATVMAEIAACGRLMNLPGLDDQEIDLQVKRVQREWEKPPPRLLIFDNCEHENLFNEYRPKTGGARILVTSRRGKWSAGLGMTTVPLDLLSRTESIQLLQQFGPPLSGEEAAADAAAIAEALGDLPLALHLAGSYLAYYEGAVSPQAFLAELDKAGPFHEALTGEFEGHSPTDHERDVARTFALGYGRLAEGDALTHRILINLAHLAPGEPVPIELLRATLGEEGKRPSDKEIMNARQRLVSLGLVTVQSNHTLQIHRLLHHFVRRVIDPEDFEAALAAVETGVINETKRLNEAGKPAALLNWQNHLRHVTNDALPRQDERSAELAKNLGYHLQQVAHYDGAKSYMELALAINEKVLAPDHPDTALILNNLGKLLRDMGHLESAKTHLERAAAIHEQTLGPDHPDTAMSLSALGRVLQIIGDELDRAKSYHERALAIQEQKLGPTHLQTTISLNNLGGLLIDMNDRETARDYFERALAIREETLGPDHPRTAQSLNNLGYLLQIMGDYDNARPYLERALDIHEQALGPEHPKTASSLNNMGELLKEMGELAEARSYFERALANWEQTVGPDHPHTAHCLNNLGEVFQKMGQPAQARPYYEQALAILQAKWGPNHTKTRIVQRNLASLAA